MTGEAMSAGNVLPCGHPQSAMGKVWEGDASEAEHCLWCGDIKDMGTLIRHCSHIYCEASGGLISKPMTHPEHVVQLLQEREQKACDEAVAEAEIEWKEQLAARDAALARCRAALEEYREAAEVGQRGLMWALSFKDIDDKLADAHVAALAAVEKHIKAALAPAGAGKP